MAIKVAFSENQRDIIVGGLYQWDFGQSLEIECAELGSQIVEIHFACVGMSEAIVRLCTFNADGVGNVAIPDQCLEQARNITAWIYSIVENDDEEVIQGHTIKTITLPITARIRPSASRTLPTEQEDRYTEALAAINAATENIERGNIVAAEATHAVSADTATTAQNAASATYATSAGRAENATKADEAETAHSSNTSYFANASLASTYSSYLKDYSFVTECEITGGTGTRPDALATDTLYLVFFYNPTHPTSCGCGVLYYAHYLQAFQSCGAVGEYTLYIYGTESKTVLYGTSETSGTLKFYKLGEGVGEE